MTLTLTTPHGILFILDLRPGEVTTWECEPPMPVHLTGATVDLRTWDPSHGDATLWVLDVTKADERRFRMTQLATAIKEACVANEKEPRPYVSSFHLDARELAQLILDTVR